MKYVLFDLDGTIIDTLEGLKGAVNHALTHYNHPLRTLNEIRLFIGNGVQKLLERSFPEGTSKEELENAFNLFKEYYAEHCIHQSTPYKGMLEMLTRLKEKYTLAVVSNKNDPFAKQLVEFYYPGIFTVIQGTYNDKPKKPDPYIVNKCLEQLGAKKEECLFVGDTPVDVQTAINSSLRRIIVTYGFRSKEELIKVVPNEDFVDTIEELEKKIMLTH